MVHGCSCVSPWGLEQGWRNGHHQPCQLKQWLCHHLFRIKPFLHTEMHNQGLSWGFSFLLEPQQQQTEQCPQVLLPPDCVVLVGMDAGGSGCGWNAFE